MSDKIYLGDGAVYDTGSKRNGYNDNVLVIGPTGAGKTLSINIPTALHLSDSSAVMSFSKRKDARLLIKSFTEKGYNVIDLNLLDPTSSLYAYDPLDYLNTDEDIMDLASSLINVGVTDSNIDADTKYWNSSAANVISALLSLLKMTDIPSEVLSPYCNDRKPTFADLMKLNGFLRFTETKNGVVTPLDRLFDEVGNLFGDCMAVRTFKTLQGLSVKTASCIASVANEALVSLLSPTVVNLLADSNKKHIDFTVLGKEKTALIITTNPLNKALSRYTTLLYYQLYKTLFEQAEKAHGTLCVPVMTFLDDLGNNKIEKLDQYISIFRSAGISVVMFVQSLEQLNLMYGRGASVIKDNCSKLCFFTGSLGLETCNDISIRTNRPLNTVLSEKIGKVIICRSGYEAVITARYHTLEDEVYRRAITSLETDTEKMKEPKSEEMIL